MRRIGLIIVLVLVDAACSESTVEPIEVTGSTRDCTESGTTWSGQAPPGAAVPGLVLERTVSCPNQTMSDERLPGVCTSEIRCEFSTEEDATLGDCLSDSVPSNDGGTWVKTC